MLVCLVALPSFLDLAINHSMNLSGGARPTPDRANVAHDHCPTFGGKPIPSAPRGCFSDITGAHNLRQGMGEEVTFCIPRFARREAIGNLIPIVPATGPTAAYAVGIESLSLRNKLGKTSEKHHALLMQRKSFEGIQARGCDAKTESHRVWNVNPLVFWFPDSRCHRAYLLGSLELLSSAFPCFS